MTESRAPSFLVIRRDNIGDLVCTTPLINALRQRFPAARICALVNSYNRAVLEHHPNVDEIYTYTKAKHRLPGQSAVRVYWERLQMIQRLRREAFDYAILAAPGFQKRALLLARLIRPRHVVGYVVEGTRQGVIDMAVPYAVPRPAHEVEDTFALGRVFGIEGPAPAVRVWPDPEKMRAARQNLDAALPGEGPVIGVHISARKPSQRWAAERFVELMHGIRATMAARFLLFWSPGAADNPQHPGDDAKAGDLLRAADLLPVLPVPTQQLPELIAGLGLCDMVICSDGGAMHLAAGLGKPILCFFGKSSLAHWHPWGVPYVALQPASEDVADISVADALAGFEQLSKKVESGPGPSQASVE